MVLSPFCRLPLSWPSTMMAAKLPGLAPAFCPAPGPLPRLSAKETTHLRQGSLPRHQISAAATGKQDRMIGGAKAASAAGLIMGTAVGPGILGLPAATIQAGLLPGTATILAAWAYVMASILLVTELSYAVMAEQGGAEVSFSGLAERTLGRAGAVIASSIYAMLNYSLLVACIAGLGSVFSTCLPPTLPWPLLCLASPAVVATTLALGSFTAVDALNKLLCFLMLASITGLVLVGVGPSLNLNPARPWQSVWTAQAMLQAAPVTVLTLGFHVITPLVCKVVGGSPDQGRAAVVCGGAVPLAMVLAWNTLILLLCSPSSPKQLDPIALLLSVSSYASPLVQAFAFSALGTTLIGYCLSFPKQLSDTAALFLKTKASPSPASSTLAVALVPAAAVASLCPTAFAAALRFAGVYANCFLFGLLPPIMAWRYRYCLRKDGQHRDLVPGGKGLLMLLTAMALFLGTRPVPG